MKVEKLETWQLLREIDELMKNNPSYKKDRWQEAKPSGQGFGHQKNRLQRNKERPQNKLYSNG